MRVRERWVSQSLADDLQKLKGVGPATSRRLQALGIADRQGLLLHLPRKYLMRKGITPATRLRTGDTATVLGQIEEVRSRAVRNGRLQLVEALLQDSWGQVALIWFLGRRRGQPNLPAPVRRGEKLVATGKVRLSPSGPQIASPYLERLDSIKFGLDPEEIEFPPVPFYPLTQGLTQQKVRQFIQAVLKQDLPLEYLPNQLLSESKVPPLPDALKMIHTPKRMEDIEKGHRRLALEEFLLFFMHDHKERAIRKNVSMPKLVGLLDIDDFTDQLPFRLTKCQREAIDACRRQMQSSRPMRTLLLGDVGSGKTVVAAYALASVALSGMQAAFMAPTKLLAEQHAKTLTELLSPWDIRVLPLLSGMKTSDRSRTLELLHEGEPLIVVGTHALLSEDVHLQKLGIAVIDEQHRFGVRQREALLERGAAHALFMSATPIPRTLAQTLYAGMDVLTLKEKPPGRKPVDTRWILPKDRAKVYQFVKQQVKKGRRAFVVYPRVHGDQEGDDSLAATTQAKELVRNELTGVQVGLLHGQMDSDSQERIMKGFVAGTYQVLVATTVIEVGVDVPEASVMVIEGADTFGLAQLHQLRGRVGRGRDQAYCLLIAEPKTEEAKARMDALRRIDDGQKIAEMDLHLRGPGEFRGVRQAGLSDFLAADLIKDQDLLQKAGRFIEGILPEVQNDLLKRSWLEKARKGRQSPDG